MTDPHKATEGKRGWVWCPWACADVRVTVGVCSGCARNTNAARPVRYRKRFKVVGFLEVDVEADDPEQAERRYCDGGWERRVHYPCAGDLEHVFGPNWDAVDDGAGWVRNEEV